MEYGPATYGDRIADVYDDRHGFLPPAEETVAFLAALAGTGRALELGIGTGRIAIPLAAAGAEVHGVDASEAMVARLRAKPGGEAIPVTIGDFADLPVDGEFALIYIPFNTFFGLLTQEAQLRCFAAVASHLAPGGAFVIEAFVPDQTYHPRGQSVSADDVGTDAVRLRISRHDRATQVITTQVVELTPGGNRFWPVQIRYAYPGELDLMARLAGLRLEARYADWTRAPFDAGSDGHVSVYRR